MEDAARYARFQKAVWDSSEEAAHDSPMPAKSEATARPLSKDELRMRDACFHDVLQVIKHAVDDSECEDGKEHLRILGASINENGPEGFGYDPKEHLGDTSEHDNLVRVAEAAAAAMPSIHAHECEDIELTGRVIHSTVCAKLRAALAAWEVGKK